MLADDIMRVLPELRAAAESLMLDTCTITRVDPDAIRGPIDPATNQYPPLPRITVYSGKCKLQDKSVIAASTAGDSGERAVVTQGSELQLPVIESADVAINDIAHMDTCVNDPSLTGHEYTIAARHGKSQATARRLRVIEVTA